MWGKGERLRNDYLNNLTKGMGEVAMKLGVSMHSIYLHMVGLLICGGEVWGRESVNCSHLTVRRDLPPSPTRPWRPPL